AQVCLRSPASPLTTTSGARATRSVSGCSPRIGPCTPFDCAAGAAVTASAHGETATGASRPRPAAPTPAWSRSRKFVDVAHERLELQGDALRLLSPENDND